MVELSYSDIIIELSDCPELTVWEYDFIMDMLDQEYEYTHNQKKKIDQISDKYEI